MASACARAAARSYCRENPLKIGIANASVTLYDGPAKVEGLVNVRAALLPRVSAGNSADFATRTCAAAAAAWARAAARSGRLRSAALITLSTLTEISPTGIAAGIGARSNGRVAGRP